MAEIPTAADIEALFAKFKVELLNELEQKLSNSNANSSRWMRGSAIKKQMYISESTLIRLRIKGLIKFRKLGGIYFYDSHSFLK